MVLVNSFRNPPSDIRYEQRNIRAVFDKKDLGLGTLFVSEGTLCWQVVDCPGFALPYQNIALHAISKDETVYPRECIYLVMDRKFELANDDPPSQIASDESDNSEDDSEIEGSELILVPQEAEDHTSIVNIYEAIKLCQELNPDPEDMEDDEDDHLYADAEEEPDEGDYIIQDRGAGDNGDIDELSRRMEENFVDYVANGNDDDEFQDAD